MLGSDRRRTALAATFIVALTALLGASSAHGAGWRAGVDVSSPQPGVGCGLFCFRPGAAGTDVAVSANGDAVIAWTRRDDANQQIVQARFRPAGGSFGPVQSLGVTNGQYGFGIFGPLADAAIDDAGRALVVWPGEVGGNTVVQASRRTPGGNFGPVFNLSDASMDVDPDPRIVMSRNGHALVVWTLTTPNPDVVQFSSASPGGGFTAATGLSDGADADAPRAAISNSGAAVVSWAQGSPGIVRSRLRPSGAAAFGAPQTLSEGADPAAMPDVAIDGQGRATVVWTQGPGAGDVRVLSRALTTAGAPASGIDEVSDVGRDGNSPQVALDPSNTAVATWIDCPTTTSNCVVATAARPSGASFGAVQPVSAPGDSNLFPKVVVDSNGTAVIAWSQVGTPIRIQTIRRFSNGSFSGVESISAPSGDALSPALAVDGAGSTVAGWAFTRDSDSRQTAQFGVFDGGAPELRNLAFSNGRALQPLSFSVAPFDRFSPVTVSWSFGDGTSLAGSAVTKTFSSAGTFNAAVTATDAAGNSAQANAAVQVGQPDRDGDGFPQGQDCNDNNRRIRPGAVEIRGNRVDENCDGRRPDFLQLRVTVSHDFAAFRSGTRFSRFQVKRIPRGSTLRASCKVGKRKCPGKARKKFTKKRARGTVSLKKRYVGVFLPKKTKITVRVTKPRTIGAVKIVTIRGGKAPKITDRCVRPGSSRVRRCG